MAGGLASRRRSRKAGMSGNSKGSIRGGTTFAFTVAVPFEAGRDTGLDRPGATVHLRGGVRSVRSVRSTRNARVFRGFTIFLTFGHFGQGGTGKSVLAPGAPLDLAGFRHPLQKLVEAGRDVQISTTTL
jgi:hypothetical protein